jgi:dephospho-CoA kinase
LIDSDGRLDRAKLRGLVFNDPKARQRLEHILHPRIRAEMQQQLAQASSAYAILAIPLLFETGQHQVADRVLVIDLPEALQIERVQARSGLDEAQVRRIIASQVERGERLAGADDIIDNRGPTQALEPQVERLHRHYLLLASQHSSAQPGASD